MAQIDFENELNPEQLAAATAPDGPIFVLAAAGTGKTRTLVYRVAYLINRGIDPRRLLLLTFTNRAAKEMLERAEALVSQGVQGMWSGTFHHAANRILRRHASLIGYNSDYIILDTGDSRSLIRECLEDLRLKSKEFPKPEVLLSLISSAANRNLDLESVIENHFENQNDSIKCDKVLAVCELYQEKKTRQNLMDFDDLLVNSLKLFYDHRQVLERYQEHFLYTMVDEYQDTNSIQAELVDLLSAKQRNLLVVGDDFQSIYAWRGADYRNIMSFPARYPDAKLLKLETNYRSTPEILDLANCCIAGNPQQFKKELRPTRPSKSKPVVALLRDGDQQARYVISELRRQHSAGCAWEDMAVLYRAHHHALELQMALAKERIPYIVTSGVRFFEQAHVKDVCAFLRVLNSPTDVLAFKRLVMMLPKVGAKTADRLWQKSGAQFNALSASDQERLMGLLPQASRETWSKILTAIAAYDAAELKDDPGEAATLFIKAFYGKYAAENFEDYRRRIDDLREMVIFTANFKSTEEFLNEVALVTNLDSEAAKLEMPENTLRLSTVHQAKGLEWRLVVIIWASDGMFPSSRSMEELDGEEEERRLFYVAVTRAKDHLILCSPKIRRTFGGNIEQYLPSRFIREIPAGKIKPYQVGFI